MSQHLSLWFYLKNSFILYCSPGHVCIKKLMFLCLVNERNWQNSHRLATLLATFRSSFTAWWRSVENYSFIILFTETLNRNKKFLFIHNLITMRPTPIVVSKELSLWNKIKYLNLNIFRTRFFKPLILQPQIFWSNKIHSLKYLRSATLD